MYIDLIYFFNILFLTLSSNSRFLKTQLHAQLQLKAAKAQMLYIAVVNNFLILKHIYCSCIHI